MTTERALEIMQYSLERFEDFGIDTEGQEALKLAMEVLREKQERENPQPLTVEQLKERAGKPYYHVSLQGSGNEWEILNKRIAENPLGYG